MELDLNSFTYYIRPGFTGMRKGPVVFTHMVEECMKQDPFYKSVLSALRIEPQDSEGNYMGRDRLADNQQEADGTRYTQTATKHVRQSYNKK